MISVFGCFAQVPEFCYDCMVLALVNFLFKLLPKSYPICDSALKPRYLQFRELRFLLFFHLMLHSFLLELKFHCHSFIVLSIFLPHLFTVAVFSVLLAVLLFVLPFLLSPFVIFRRNPLYHPLSCRRPSVDLAVDCSIHL